jgi:large subunit ribosomal protein L13
VDTLSYKTKSVNKESANQEWILIDAENEVIGRMASQIAKILRGKHKPTFTPHSDCGDKVVVINAAKARFTGSKMDNKTYISHTGYPGGQREITAKALLAKKPTALVEKAVKNMLPKTKLGKAIFVNNLYVYEGAEHPHTAQKPKQIFIKDIK